MLKASRLAFAIFLALAGASTALAQDSTGPSLPPTAPGEPDPQPSSDASEEEGDGDPTDGDEPTPPPAPTPPEPTSPPEPADTLGAPTDATTTQQATGEQTGTGPTAEAAAAEDEAPAAAPAPFAFRGSQFSWQNGVSTNTFAPETLSDVPFYYQAFSLGIRYYLDGQNFFQLSLGAQIELTDSASSISAIPRQFFFGDTSLDFRHTEVVGGFILIPSARVTAPTSLASIENGRILNTSLGLTAVKVFPELASLTLAAFGRYGHWFGTTTTGGLDPEEPSGGPGYLSPNVCVTVAGSIEPCGGRGAPLRDDTLSLGGQVTVMPLSGLTVSMTYQFVWSVGQPLRSAVLPNGTELVGADTSNHWSNFQYWGIAAGYDLTNWLNLALGYQSGNGVTVVWNSDGGVRNPFYNLDSEIYLSATTNIDGLMELFQGGEDDGLTPEERQRRRQGLSFGRPRTNSF